MHISIYINVHIYKYETEHRKIKNKKYQSRAHKNKDGFNRNNAKAHNQSRLHFQQSINHQLSLIILFSTLSSISNNLNFKPSNLLLLLQYYHFHAFYLLSADSCCCCCKADVGGGNCFHCITLIFHVTRFITRMCLRSRIVFLRCCRIGCLLFLLESMIICEYRKYPKVH